jgi:hypothetical protein
MLKLVLRFVWTALFAEEEEDAIAKPSILIGLMFLVGSIVLVQGCLEFRNRVALDPDFEKTHMQSVLVSSILAISGTIVFLLDIGWKSFAQNLGATVLLIVVFCVWSSLTQVFPKPKTTSVVALSLGFVSAVVLPFWLFPAGYLGLVVYLVAVSAVRWQVYKWCRLPEILHNHRR